MTCTEWFAGGHFGTSTFRVGKALRSHCYASCMRMEKSLCELRGSHLWALESLHFTAPWFQHPLPNQQWHIHTNHLTFLKWMKSECLKQGKLSTGHLPTGVSWIHQFSPSTKAARCYCQPKLTIHPNKKKWQHGHPSSIKSQRKKRGCFSFKFTFQKDFYISGIHGLFSKSSKGAFCIDRLRGWVQQSSLANPAALEMVLNLSHHDPSLQKYHQRFGVFWVCFQGPNTSSALVFGRVKSRMIHLLFLLAGLLNRKYIILYTWILWRCNKETSWQSMSNICKSCNPAITIHPSVQHP